MSDHLTKEELFLAYLDDLDETKSKIVYKHLQNCDDCRQILLDYEAIEKSFQSQTFLKPSPETIANIEREARNATGSVKTKWFWFVSPTWLKLASSAFVLILMIGTVYNFYGSSDSQMDAQKKSVTMTSSEPEEITDIEEEEVHDDIMEEVLGYNYIDAEPEPENRDGKSENKSERRKKSDKLFERAQQFQNLKQYQIAMKIYYRILRKDRKYEKKADVYYHLAFCLSEVGRYHESLKRIKKLEKLDSNFPGLVDLKLHVEKSIENL